jgi:hypothetical protein
LAVVAAVLSPSNDPVMASFDPSSTAVADPDPVKSARVLASAGTGESLAL